MPLEPMVPDPDYHAMRLVWCDSAGIRRCRVIPSSSASQHGVGLTKACMAAPAYHDRCAPNSGLGPVGEVRLVADEAALIPVLPWHPAHGMTIANMVKTSGEPWSCCPREALRRTLQLLEQRHGLTLQVGFESEFVLFNRVAPTGGVAQRPDASPVDSSVYAQTRSLDAQAELLDLIAQSLESMGIGVVQYHAESAPGQFEMVTTHCPALEACDKLLMTRETICGVVRRQTDLAVSFLPKHRASDAGSGCHMHISLQQGGKNVMLEPDVTAQPGSHSDFPRLSVEASCFLAGVLHHLPSLLMFTCPSTVSYARLQPCSWSGAYTAWGWDNREAPLRMTSPPGGPNAANVEFKSMDATANPHIALAALVTAGMLGLSGGMTLPPPLQVDPLLDLSEEARRAAGIRDLPKELNKAIEACAADASLQVALLDTLGEPLLKTFTAVRSYESKHKAEQTVLLTRY